MESPRIFRPAVILIIGVALISAFTKATPIQNTAEFRESGENPDAPNDNVVRHLDAIGGGHVLRQLERLAGDDDAMLRKVRKPVDVLHGSSFGGNKRSDPFLLPSYGKRNFDEIDRAGFNSFIKKNFDEIDRSGFNGFDKKNFDEIDRSGFNSFIKKNFDEIDRSGFNGFMKKNFDEIDRSGFNGFMKKNFDEIDRSGFNSFMKKNFDEIDRSGFNSFMKKNFDEIDRVGFGEFRKRLIPWLTHAQEKDN